MNRNVPILKVQAQFRLGQHPTGLGEMPTHLAGELAAKGRRVFYHTNSLCGERRIRQSSASLRA